MAGEPGIVIEDLLDRLLLERGVPTAAVVGIYAEMHPEHRGTLIDFAAGWAEETHLPDPTASSEREDAVARRAIEGFRKASSSRPARSLAQLASAIGKTLEDLADNLGIEEGVVAMLNARRIIPESIGPRLVASIARLLLIDIDTVTASWALAPTAFAGAAFLGREIGLKSQTLRQVLMESGADNDVIDEFCLPVADDAPHWTSAPRSFIELTIDTLIHTLHLHRNGVLARRLHRPTG